MVLALQPYMAMKQMDSLKDRIEVIEREEIVRALRECNWVMAKAAKRLGITERMIGYKIKKYGLRIKEVRWIENSQDESLKHEIKQ